MVYHKNKISGKCSLRNLKNVKVNCSGPCPTYRRMSWWIKYAWLSARCSRWLDFNSNLTCLTTIWKSFVMLSINLKKIKAKISKNWQKQYATILFTHMPTLFMRGLQWLWQSSYLQPSNLDCLCLSKSCFIKQRKPMSLNHPLRTLLSKQVRQ